MARTQILGMCALWPWPYDLGSRSWHTLGSWTTIVWNIIQIQLGSEELWPGHGFWVYVHCDLDLGGMTLGQGHDTPLSHGQQLCEILSRMDKRLRSYGSVTMWTDGKTDRRTNRQGDSYIPPPNFVCGGIIKGKCMFSGCTHQSVCMSFFMSLTHAKNCMYSKVSGLELPWLETGSTLSL